MKLATIVLFTLLLATASCAGGVYPDLDSGQETISRPPDSPPAGEQPPSTEQPPTSNKPEGDDPVPQVPLSPVPTTLAKPKPGQKVLVAEQVKRIPFSGTWVLAYTGVLRSWQNGKALVRLTGRLSYRYSPREKGVNSKDWFCAPRRRHCYSSVPFGDWGGTLKPGQVAAFSNKQVSLMTKDPKDALHRVALQAARP